MSTSSTARELSAKPKSAKKLLEAAIDLYRDDYLISDPYADWAENEARPAA
ncbi:MAG: hypothetical protein U0175_37625 [Caldilineaceae bacterium]